MAIAGGGLAIAAVIFSQWFAGISQKMIAARKDAKLKASAGAIATKFNDDPELNGFMTKLQQFPYMKPLMAGKRETVKVAANNKERSKILREMAKYVKSKLNQEEMEFFIEVNKMLKTKPLETNDGQKVEEDLQQMADAVLDPSNSNAESSINKDPNRTVGTGTYTSTASDLNVKTKGIYKTNDPASGGWNPIMT